MKRKIVLYFSAFAVLFSLVGGIGISVAEPSFHESVPVTIIMYHSILNSPKSQGAYCVSEQVLKNDIQYMLECGYTPVVMADLDSFVNGTGTLPPKPVVITFDDGYYNNYTYAYALLKEYNVRAVLSPIGIYSEQYSVSGDKNPNYAHLSFEDLGSISDVFEIQNHSYNMHTVGGGRFGSRRCKCESEDVYKKTFCDDALKMQQLLLDMCGITPICYTYPYGAMCKESKQYIKELGFRASMSCEEGVSVIERGNPDSLYSLKRYNRASGRKISEFITK